MSGKAIRETVGFLAVVASMVFVGVEIRQNTNAVRGATLHGIADQSFQYNVELVQDADWMRIMTLLRGGGTAADLDPVDQQRVQWGLMASTRIMENRFRQYQLGILDEAGLQQLSGAADSGWYGSEFFREWWTSTGPETVWAEDFVTFMEQQVMGPVG